MNEYLNKLDQYIERFQRIIDRMNSIMDSFSKISAPSLEGGQWGDEVINYWRNIGERV